MVQMMSSSYDFIVVGAGPSGCVVASRLANSAAKPSVLLLEAGRDNTDKSYFIPADRFNLAFSQPALNWGYKTQPQSHLKGQRIDYSRGKGLGGSTAINFCCWVIGADEDYHEWARLVGDEAWSWENVARRFKNIENYHVEIPKEHQKYVAPKAIDHGTSGPLNLSYASNWEKNIADVFIAAEQVGMGNNLDTNSGNPIGMGLTASTMYKGLRTTASSAYLQNPPANLTIVPNTLVSKVCLSGKNASGVITVDGREYKASKDVILSGGALNSPQLLMLSGIGPSDELEKHDIKVVHELPFVGKNLQDHCSIPITLIQKPESNDRMAFATDEILKGAAEEQYSKDGTGPLSEMYCSTPMGWFKNNNVYNSTEFHGLPKHIQEQIRKPTVPIWELATHIPPLYLGDHKLGPHESYLTVASFVMNPQSVGEVTLASSNPEEAPKIDPRLLSHPYDRRVAIEAVRQTMDYLNAPIFEETKIKTLGPKSRSDEDIWDHISSNVLSSWHMCSTVKMGKAGDKEACVDTNFKVLGVENLRVVDLSVIALIPNNHTQSTAYLVGETAAEKLIAEYKLDAAI